MAKTRFVVDFDEDDPIALAIEKESIKLRMGRSTLLRQICRDWYERQMATRPLPEGTATQ